MPPKAPNTPKGRRKCGGRAPTPPMVAQVNALAQSLLHPKTTFVPTSGKAAVAQKPGGV